MKKINGINLNEASKIKAISTTRQGIYRLLSVSLIVWQYSLPAEHHSKKCHTKKVTTNIE